MGISSQWPPNFLPDFNLVFDLLSTSGVIGGDKFGKYPGGLVSV